MDKDAVEKIMSKYKEKLNKELSTDETPVFKPVTSREYIQFKKDILPPHFTVYERLCNLSEKILNIKPDPKKSAELQKLIDICHLNITPAGAVSFSILTPLIIVLFGSLFGFMVFGSYFFVIFFLIVGAALLITFEKLPELFANNWRLKASNQMVISIFYVVTYMRHTSNLENALNFASEHLTGMLSLDFKKVLWDVETEKFASVKESLDNYLETWREWNMEFIEAFHLIESSLYESSEARRLIMLDKSLEVILEETYEKMLHYAQNLKSPITMLHMLGIILPILGLVILPLVVSFMEGVKWYHLATLYDVALPIGVYYLGKTILSKRPTGYGDSDISEENPELKKYKNVTINLGFTQLSITPLIFAFIAGALLFLAGLSPLIIHQLNPDFDIVLMDGKIKLLGYITTKNNEVIGPYGLIAAIIGLLVPLSFGIGAGIYYRLRSRNVIKIREETKKLEQEFASALFQLGNRLGDGLPTEIAFVKVADTMKGTTSGSFFQVASNNITRLGMSVKRALFDAKVGALVYFPSKIIKSSMMVLIESSKKGPIIAAQALMNVSQYIKEIHRVDERLKDLLADVISSMKSQIGFLTPVIAGIVVGITSMVTAILNSLSEQMTKLSEEGGTAQVSTLSNFFGNGIPTYYFQLIVGIYVIEIIFILTVLVNGVENGSDSLGEQYSLGNSLIKAPLLYSAVALIVMVLFNMVASQIMTVSTIAG